MTDHGFEKLDYSSNLPAIKDLAKEISGLSSVICTHVVLSDRDVSKPTYSIIAFCKGVRKKATQKALKAIVSESGSPPHSTEVLLVRFTYKDGDHIPPGHPHAFGCDKSDEPYAESP